jgi:hypothetical protein
MMAKSKGKARRKVKVKDLKATKGGAVKGGAAAYKVRYK